MEHTQGEWKVQPFDGKGSCIDIDSKKGLICQVYSLEETDYKTPHSDELKANAKLIAAAPELLDVLKQCEQILTGLFHTARVQQTSILTNTNFADQENYNAIADRFSSENKENYAILKNVKLAIKKATE